MSKFEETDYPDAGQFLSVFVRYFRIAVFWHLAVAIVVVVLVMLVEADKGMRDFQGTVVPVAFWLLSFSILISFDLGWTLATAKLSIRSVGQVCAVGTFLTILLLFLFVFLSGVAFGGPVYWRWFLSPGAILMAFAMWVGTVWWVSVLRNMCGDRK